MPELSRFFGIVVYMYFNDHNPPHFHIQYGEYKAAVSIDSLQVIDGNIPVRVLGLVKKWANQHKKELLNNWNSLQETGTYGRIKPLT